MAAAASPDRAHRLLMVAIDIDFYRRAHPDLTHLDIDPAGHYGADGWREGRDPAPWFSTDAYLEQNPDVAAAGVNPFVHYLTAGWREGREIAPSDRAADYFAMLDGGGGGGVSAAEHQAAAAFFDPAFYLAMNPDVGAAGGDLLDHFLRLGWREGRDPSYDFSVADYLELNPDVAAGGRHPFIHYVMQGRHENRVTKADHGFRQQVLATLKPFSERLADARRWAKPVDISAAGLLADALRAAPLQGLHITFSQDDYSRSVGGSQLCVQRESAEFARLGRNHLHIHPVNGWPTVRAGATETPMGVLLNGERVGAFIPGAVAEALRAATPAGPGSFAIHNMLGHSSRDVIDIVRSAGLNAGWFWLHDMGSLCAGVHLQRNDVESCGAPPQGSAACGICVYGPARAAHVREHQRLFERLDLTLASPSQVALEAWRAGGRLETMAERVLPHAALVPTREAPARETAAQRRFRFAFPGTPSVHKGWPIFRHLAARFAGDPRYEFIHLASRPVAGSLARHHPVTVTAEAPLAMRQALLDLQVDAAMVWSLCLETFSFAAYEAVAAGAAVLTGPDSGNVAAFVRETGHGLVLDDERALEALFESGEILRLGRAERGARTFDLAFSKLTAELVEQP